MAEITDLEARRAAKKCKAILDEGGLASDHSHVDAFLDKEVFGYSDIEYKTNWDIIVGWTCAAIFSLGCWYIVYKLVVYLCRG